MERDEERRRVNVEPWELKVETRKADSVRREEEERERYVDLGEPDKAAEDWFYAEAEAPPETLQQPTAVLEGCGSGGDCMRQSRGKPQ
ncbi:hypothetical protein NDU88_003301 [Pleurodeles waltl]|uniref:Uncharacterized protein n=1 Tax=Pleurodeles waltl TaxID=8319 RepID=A0AAV7KUF3_PLEWA|nr:hypothetical protein NDU88_003301 [Pleurodeles waltl]